MRNLTIKKKYIYTVFFIIIFKLILEYGYYVFVYPVYEYSGFVLDTSVFKMIESYLVVTALSFLLAKLDDYNKPSKVVLYILFINLYLPISSLYWLQDNSRVFYLVISFSILILYILIVKVRRINIITPKEGGNLALFILIGITIIVYGYLIVTGGLQRINLNLLNVYETRDAYSESTIPLLGYLLPWQANIINLFLLIYGLIKNKKGFVLFVLFLQILLFAMTNFKSFLFAPLVVLALYIVSKKDLKNILLLLIASTLSLLMFFMILLYKITGNITLLSIFLRRLFFVPADLHYLYYDFFMQMEKYKLSHSIFDTILENPYGITPVALVARDVYKSDFAPNVGIFGDAYLNFGLIGICVFVIILGAILVLFDSIAIKSPLILSMSIIIIPSMALVNSALMTSLATHGILFAIFVTWMTSTIFKMSEGNNNL